MLRFLFHVGKAVANQGLGGIARAIADPLAAGDVIGKVAFEVWGGLRAERKQDRLHADILEAVKLDAAEIRRQAAEIAAQVAPGNPELAGHVERFITLVPAAIQASLRRPDDPTGTTLPARFAVEDESDIVKLLPVRFPRAHFKPGYAPPFLRGWELVEQIGAGGFGEVWKVRSQRANSLVGAVKFGHALSDAELSLLNEGDVLNRLLATGKHPGIVELQDVWADGDEIPWIRYEYVPGGDLTQLMRRWATLPMEQRLPKVLAAFRELCETVGHFHQLKPSPIVHRDLKPSNILVAADGKLKIGDFGIGSVSAKRVLDGERHGTLSKTNTVQAYLRGAHTPLYAPPEQKSDPKHRPQPTDDVHALGVILYQMLTGRLDAAPGPKFDRDLAGVPKKVIELIGDCVDGEKSRRPADGTAILARASEPEPVVVTPARDHAKEGAERRAREEAERKRAEREAAEVKRKRERDEQAHREREQREEREAEQRAAEARRNQPRRSGWRVPVITGVCLLVVVGALLALFNSGLKPGVRNPEIVEKPEVAKKPVVEKLWNSPEWAALKSGTKAGEEVTLPLGTSGVDMTFCWCPPGKFERGSNDGRDDEEPVKEITIGKGFWMAKTETTQAQWAALGFPNESKWKGDTLPVENVSHTEAVAFADKLKQLSGKAVRLPTEAEWEYACRAGTKFKYHSGDSEADLADVGWYAANSGFKTHPVGQKKANAWGLHDMHGNVWEWCADWYDAGYYAKSSITDPAGPESGSSRVRRGGSWLDLAWYCRAACRSRDSPDSRNVNLGFRLAAGPSGQ